MVIKHRTLVAKLKKSGKTIKDELSDVDADMIHMVMGISGEAGELLDAVKKAVIYRKPIDVENVLEELGDIEFFLEGFRQILGIERQDTLDGNIKKLKARYDKLEYSDNAAQLRADKQ